MWFGKSIMTKLGLALALAVPAFAAPVEPLQFENISGEQQEYWNFLTKFKLWGTNGITTGRLKLPDSSGWTGCAKGGFVGHNDGLELGGPIVIGGDIDFSNMDKFKFLSGPVRTTGDFFAGNDNGGHFFAGAICVEGGDVNSPVKTGINRANGNSSLATLQLGKTAATQGICAYNKVSEVRTDLAVPVLTGSPSYGSFVHVFGGWDNPVFIDVPPQNAGDPEVYDLYLTSIVFENDSRLVVRMPEKGRLTRIFLQGELKFGTHPEILIQYMGKGSEYSGGHYTKIVNPKDIDIDTYFGNLMIYTHEPIKFSETDDHPILGTFVSTQNISIVSNMKFAGQIIGNSLTIGDEIDGSGFHYMPFDPDTLKIPEALSGGKYPENDDDALVPITLDSKAKVAVSFKYCFDLSTTNHREGVQYADINDFKKTTLSTFPICSKGESETISIAEGKTESDKKIYIHAVDDKILEKDEILLLKIFDLTGAVMPNSTSDNEFELTITDASFAKFNNKDKDPYKVKENTPNTVLKDDDIVKVINLKDFTWENVDELRLEMEDFTAVGTGSHSVNDLFNFYLDKDEDNKMVYAVISVKDASLFDYETLTPLDYKVILTLKDQNGVVGCNQDTIIRTLSVVDVNEPPTVDDPTFVIPENLGNNKLVGEVVGKDPDSLNQHGFEHLEYFIDPNNTVANAAFKITDPTKGKITVKNSTKLDYETVPGHKFEFDVFVRNCEYDANKKTYTANCLEDVISHVTVKLTDEGEPPIIIPKCETGDCPTICQGDKCIECKEESCHEECTENCDKPYDPVKVLTVSVNENSPTDYEIMRYLVRDEDFGVGHTKALTAEIKNTTSNTGAEELFGAKMEKDADGNWNVVVYVVDGSKLDYETLDFHTHDVTINVYDPDDPKGVYGSLLRVIKVVDVNEAPSLVKPVEFNMDENTPIGTVVQKMNASDPDSKTKKFRELKYSIISTDPVPFEMDSNKVKVTELLNYEKSDTTFTFKVKVEDKYDPTLFDIADVTVHVKNVHEDPIIIPDDCEGTDCTDDCIGDKCGDGKDDSPKCIENCDDVNQKKKEYVTIGIEENSKKGTELFRYSVFDEDFGEMDKLTVKAVVVDSTVKNKTAFTDLFDLKYDKTKHEIIMTLKDSTKLDYEALRQATSRNDPDPEYKVAIVVTDPNRLTDTLFRVIRIEDVNELPLFTVWPLVITENNKVPDTLGHVEHPSDIDSLSRNPALYDNYPKMTDGNIDLFDVVQDPDDPMRILLVTDVKLDCESGKLDENGDFKYDYNCGQDSAYWVVLSYGDTTLGPGAIHADQRVPVKLVDLNEEPEIKTDTIGVNENSPKGTVVDTIKWFDIDRFDTAMTFKIVNDPIGCFAIDSKTGVVTVKSNKCSGLDYEKNPTIDLKVSITDLVGVPDSLYDDKCKCQLIYTKNGLPNTVEKTIKVNIHDVNEPPSITNKTIHVKEDTKPKTVVDTVRASDPDNDPKFTDLTYTLIDGDTATFKIEPKTGALILKDTLDHESKDTYSVVVRVDDGEFADTATVKIIIDDVKEWTKVKITEASSKRKTWDDPEVIYTNEPIREICWNQDGFDTCMTDLNIAKDSVVVVKWKNPTKNYAGTDTLKIYYNNSIPSVTVVGKDTTFDAENVFTIVEDMGEADSNIYVSKPKDSIYVKIKDPAIKYDTTIAIEVSLEPIDVSKVQGTLDKMTKIVDSKIMRDETAKNVTETAVNSNQFRYSYNEIIGKDTVTVSYMTDKDENPIKVPVVNAKGKVDSVEVITVTYKTVIEGKLVEVSYQADALTGEVFVKGPSGELMEQGASKTLYASSKSDKDSTNKSTKTTYDVNEGMFTITTGGKDALGNDRVISYSVNKKGKMVKNSEGDAGFSVTYSYMNKYGNIATESVFIVVDQVAPKVEILSPVDREVVRSNSVNVVWTVDGIKQDTLTLQGLSKGPNVIVRYYRDKAGNEDSAVVYVFMKDSKDVEIAVEQPVTEISKDKIDEYYAVNPPKKGETFAVSIKNPTTGEEVETLIGGKFKTKEGSGKEPYPGVSGSKHLGPTLALDIKVPVIDGVAGLATLDDLITPDGLIALERTDAKKAHKITVNQYVEEYCEDDFEIPSDVSQVNLFDTKLKAQIWVYTSLGNFVDYFSFTQELNDPSYTDDAGLLKMYFEMKPDKDGFVKADNGKQYATGAFVYKVQATIRSKARCTIPDNTYNPEVNKGDGFGETTKRKGDVIKNSDELLKSFGYRRPQHK